MADVSKTMCLWFLVYNHWLATTPFSSVALFGWKSNWWIQVHPQKFSSLMAVLHWKTEAKDKSTSQGFHFTTHHFWYVYTYVHTTPSSIMETFGSCWPQFHLTFGTDDADTVTFSLGFISHDCQWQTQKRMNYEAEWMKQCWPHCLWKELPCK